MRLNLFIFLLAVFISGFTINLSDIKTVSADIYMRVGENGTIYFSNIPVSSGYKLYMRTRRKKNNIKNYSSVAYDKIILKASKKYKVSQNLIEAVIKAESGFNIHAVSDKGAEGLMQLMPKTQKLFNVLKPFNPYQNIYGGTEYLKSLIVKYGGNIPLALAAYNAGSKAVTKYNGIPPYNETHNYIDEVMHYYKRYSKSAK
ncbi:lytic transglycosylase domain-containing protein [Candidatus Acidulodesulfobacterium sp. H_13]|uniref:lytic transglycosylase domain-containing protein n=1 Tax=Candidatus Acidulodesulfobacterium sp. H_13 TaxID=3395470 RepID=UPI003AF4A2FF